MGKYFLFLLVWHFAGIFLLNAQDDNPTYLFNEFQDATVFLRGNSESKEKMNYDMLINSFLFIDKQTGDVQMITNPEEVVIIRIGDRSFYQEEDGGIEIIPLGSDVTLYVQYRIKSKVEAPKGAYGGSTETSSVTSYSGLYKDNRRVEFDPKRIIPGDRYNVYWIEKGSKKKQIRTVKQLLKIYPEHKAALESYIKENKIRFENANQIKQLCLYAEGL